MAKKRPFLCVSLSDNLFDPSLDDQKEDIDIILLQDLHYPKKIDLTHFSALKKICIFLQLLMHWLKSNFVIPIREKDSVSPILIPFADVEWLYEKHLITRKIHKIYYFEQLLISALKAQKIPTKGLAIIVIEDFTKQWSISVFDDESFYFKRTCCYENLHHEIFSTISYLKEHCQLSLNSTHLLYLFTNDQQISVFLDGWTIKKIPYNNVTLLQEGIRSPYAQSFFLPFKLLVYSLHWGELFKKVTLTLTMFFAIMVCSFGLRDWFMDTHEFQYYLNENIRLQKKPENLEFFQLIEKKVTKENPLFKKILEKITSHIDVSSFVWKPFKNQLILTFLDANEEEKEQLHKEIRYFLKHSIQWSNKGVTFDVLPNQKDRL